MQSKGIVPTYEPAICKAFGTETLQRIATAGMGIMGQYGQLEPGSSYVPLLGAPEREYLANIGVITAAGTSEVQRNKEIQQQNWEPLLADYRQKRKRHSWR